VKDANDTRRQDRFWTDADLTLEVVSKELEVVSKDKQERDLIEKRHEYPEAGVPEYWIVKPQNDTITVLTLAGAAYVEHGIFQRGDTATSVVLPGFQVNVSAVFDAK
jgi:Uma2 family endonuclease